MADTTKALNTLVQSVMDTEFEENLRNKQMLNKLSVTRYEKNLDYGDELDVILPGRVTMNPWSGGDLENVEVVKATTVKIPVDTGFQVNFELEKAKADQIMNAPGVDAAKKLIREYTDDTRYKFVDNLDQKVGGLAPLAGHKIDNNGAAVVIDKDNAALNLALMGAKFKSDKNKFGTSWQDGKMIAFIDPFYEFHLMQSAPYLAFVETGATEIRKGAIARLFGWDIFVSNNLFTDADGNIYPMFGVEGESTASVIQTDIKLIPYMRQESLNNAFKGAGVMGAGLGRADKLGSIKAKITV